jgi:hypothetical protein
MAVRCSQASGTAHFILDVNGYFQGPRDGARVRRPAPDPGPGAPSGPPPRTPVPAGP